jgi:hypothetical protein
MNASQPPLLQVDASTHHFRHPNCLGCLAEKNDLRTP